MLEESGDKLRSCWLRACEELEIPDTRQEAGQVAFKTAPFIHVNLAVVIVETESRREYSGYR